MKVYRFESHIGSGNGPFVESRAACAYNRTTLLYDDCEHPPGFVRETPGLPLKDHYSACKSIEGLRFGFLSLDQLQRWFKCPEGRDAMRTHGMHLNVYEVDARHVLEGEWQVVFYRDKAEIVQELDCRTLQPIG